MLCSYGIFFLNILIFSGFLGAFAKLQKTTISFVVSVRNNLAPTGWIFVKFDI